MRLRWYALGVVLVVGVYLLGVEAPDMPQEQHWQCVDMFCWVPDNSKGEMI